MIFILTFSLVSVSGYRVEKLFELAHQRLSTITIGTSICIITTMLFFPVWAGSELHNLIKNNMEKLADSLDGKTKQQYPRPKHGKSYCMFGELINRFLPLKNAGCVADYFANDVNANNIKTEAPNKSLLGYKCVLGSKATEESLVRLLLLFCFLRTYMIMHI